MKRYSIFICMFLALYASQSFAQPGPFSGGENVIQSFTLQGTGASVRIAWRTSAEKNNNYFEIQRSTDSTQFSTLALVFAHEQAENGAGYFFTDHSLSRVGAVNVYYRIRQVSMDGTFTVSETRKIGAGELRPSTR